ncbi:MAG: elongation factor G [Planctomycetes bacterium]|nr:elongation factor G [Planctomycetota bacterium]
MAITPRSLIRNIGISAHIDSGKTTLSERILFYTGKIHAIHEVKGKDGVGATMDSMDLEREKGITIQSAATYCEWDGYNINLIDTPGHVDFTIEVERSLRVLDGAILVLCGVAGVQSQSITVDRQMRRYKVPRLAFVNKCDRAGADPLRVCEALRELLQHNAVMIQHPIGLEANHKGLVDLITREAYYFEGEKGETIRKDKVPADLVDVVEAQRQKLCEALADLDDNVAAAFLDGQELTPEMLYPALRKATIERKITPVCLGSAYKNKGVQPLLDNVIRYLPSPEDISDYEALDRDKNEEKVHLRPDPKDPLVALAFKLQDGQFGQLTYCRIYQGTLRKGEFIVNSATQKKVKVPRLVQMHADQMHEIEEAYAGDIVALFGIDCSSGDTFTDGSVNFTMTSMFVPDAVVTLAVEPAKKEGSNNFSKALNRFAKEDPTFRVSRDEESSQTIIGGMGELHLEVYIERIRREYKVDVIVGQPQVAYREAISQRAEFEYTHKKQTGGSGQYAKIGGYIEPTEEVEGEPRKDYEFIDDTVGGVIPKEFMKSCDKGFTEAVQKGPQIGMPVVGMRIVINDGNTHPVDSKDIAFQTAAKFAFRECFPKAKPIILEPIMKVEVEGPEEFSGTILGGINRRRGMIQGNSSAYGQAKITALVPLKDMFGYSNDLRSQTQGKAEFSMEFAKYAQVPRNIQEELIKEAEAKKKVLAGAR